MTDEVLDDGADEGEELDVDELDPELLEGEPEDLDVEDLEDALDEDLDDEFTETFEDEAEDEDEAEADVRAKRAATSDDDDEDEDLTTPDDVEADLDTILKDRLVAIDDEPDEDDEDAEPEDRSDTGDRLQPKRADEVLCTSCFLLVRSSAPVCPVGDDECPTIRR